MTDVNLKIVAWYEELPYQEEPTPQSYHQLGQVVDPGFGTDT